MDEVNMVNKVNKNYKLDKVADKLWRHSHVHYYFINRLISDKHLAMLIEQSYNGGSYDRVVWEEFILKFLLSSHYTDLYDIDHDTMPYHKAWLFYRAIRSINAKVVKVMGVPMSNIRADMKDLI